MSRTKKNSENVWSDASNPTGGKAGSLSNRSRFAWTITGSGHYLDESIQLLEKMPNTDLFLFETHGFEGYSIRLCMMTPTEDLTFRMIGHRFSQDIIF